MNTYFLAPKTYALVVLGCQMNTADSEKIDHIFMAQGLEKCDPLIADVVIVVTCSVRERGENRMFGIIRDLKAKAKKSGRNILIGVTGCMVRKTGMRTFERSAQKRPTNITLLSEKKEAHNSDDPLFLRSANIDFTFRIEECAMIPYLINNSSQTEDKINSQTLKNKFKNAALPS
jgi:tRNA-2-methylthio-N6-dimethylallyladenosine synthase